MYGMPCFTFICSITHMPEPSIYWQNAMIATYAQAIPQPPQCGRARSEYRYLPVFNPDLCRQPDIRTGSADAELIHPIRDDPFIPRGRPVRKGAHGQGQRNGCPLSPLDKRFYKISQLFLRAIDKRRTLMHIHLRDLRAVPFLYFCNIVTFL